MNLRDFSFKLIPGIYKGLRSAPTTGFPAGLIIKSSVIRTGIPARQELTVGGKFVTEIWVNEDGFVTQYPNFWETVMPPRAPSAKGQQR